MWDMVNIKNIDDLETWLKTQPVEVAAWIAARAALRVLPIYWQWMETVAEAERIDVTALPELRFFLSSTVARKWPAAIEHSRASYYARANASIKASASVAAAANAINSAIDSANGRAGNSGSAVASASISVNDTDRFWKSTNADCKAIEAQQNLEQLPLWVDGKNPLRDDWQNLRDLLIARSERPSGGTRIQRRLAAAPP